MESIPPKSFWLMGQKIKVEFSDKLAGDNGALGQSFFNQNLIKLQKPSESFKISEDQLELTFYHELVHFILYAMNKPELNQDEAFVDMFANMLVQFNKSRRGKLACKAITQS